MPGKSKQQRVKANAASACALALQLAKNRKFPDWLLSAIYHGSAALRRLGNGIQGTRVAINWTVRLPTTLPGPTRAHRTHSGRPRPLRSLKARLPGNHPTRRQGDVR